ncbi:caspase domain-containing protein [Crepidotus variabilis]|uniref:Caspase domain-containing protein n=1 Tax=Crepidotus variabilis TaxID=179855 RepID=A0A9P6EH52_9AGAR|nr:caspase domain-containing protein [Crepidotus variabilis]
MAQTSHQTNKLKEAFTRMSTGQSLPQLNTDRSTRKKRALLITPTYGGKANHWGLVSPINDANVMKTLLINQYGYTVRTLHEGEGSDSLPTYENIKQAIDSFILKEDNVDYVLLYAGHSDQVEAKDRLEEEDGRSEFIIPCDALGDNSVHEVKREFNEILDTKKVIFDYYLHEALVEKIQQVKGSQLVAIFDSCHSCTLLNLRHHRCNRVGSFKSSLRRISRRILLEPMEKYLEYTLVRTESERSRHVPKTDAKGPMGVYLPFLSQLSNAKQCSGFCLRLPTPEKPQVICISAAKDSQFAMENNQNGSLTTALIPLFSSEPQPTYEEIMIFAQQSVAAGRDRNFKQVDEWYAKKKREATEKKGHSPAFWRFTRLPEERATRDYYISQIEAHSDPQLSSERPLRMAARLVL